MTSPGAAARLAPLSAAVAAALAGALAGAGITVAAPVTGIADPGTGVLVALPLVRTLLNVAAATTVGLCLLPLLLGPGGVTGSATADRAEPVLHRARRLSVVTSMAWAATAVAALLLHTAEFHPQTSIGPADVVTFASDVATGKALVSVIGLTLTLCALNVLAVRHRERVPAEIRAGLGVFALLPLPATGHAAGWVGHDYAVVALELHVISAVVWLGGLAALVVLLAGDVGLLATALPRFSVVATACIATTAVTGTISGLTHLSTHGSSAAPIPVALIGTPYGGLLLAKLACFGAIALAGAKMRWRILPAVVAHGSDNAIDADGLGEGVARGARGPAENGPADDDGPRGASHDARPHTLTGRQHTLAGQPRTPAAQHRTLTGGPAFAAWASVELLLLGLAFGIATVLSRAGFG